MREKLLFIYNANAGKGRIKNTLSDVVECFCRANYEVTIYATQAQQEATRFVVEQGEQYAVIVCSGGDGTINEVVTGIMQLSKKPVCGYLPMGTVNDFASSLKIPKNPVSAAEVIVRGNVYACDIGSFEEKYFNYVAAFGAFTEVAYKTPQDVKKSLGKAAYFLDALGRISDIRGYNMRVEYDDKFLEGEYIYGMISNSKSVGGFSLEGKKHHMSLDDGVFEIVLIRRPKTPVELERTLNALLTRNTDNPYIDAMRGKNICVQCEDPVAWTLDGEDGGTHRTAHIHCNERALQIFSPKKNHRQG